MAAIARFMRLHSGAKMPSIGLGTYLMQDTAEAGVDCALGLGYRHIDTAKSYNNETRIGTVLHDHFTNNKLKRKDLFLTTKVPPDRIGDDAQIKECVEESLESLQTQYLDMVLIHNPWSMRRVVDQETGEETRQLRHDDLCEAWRGMEALVRGGLTRHIGLSNVTQLQLHRIWESASIKPSNLQLECHAYLQQGPLRQFCHGRGIAVTAYSPLGAPGRTNRHGTRHLPDLINDPVVVKVAQEEGKNVAHVLIRFLLQLGVVPLPKSTNAERLKENLDSLKHPLCSKSMNELLTLDSGVKYFKFPWARGHAEYYEDHAY